MCRFKRYTNKNAQLSSKQYDSFLIRLRTSAFEIGNKSRLNGPTEEQAFPCYNARRLPLRNIA